MANIDSVKERYYNKFMAEMDRISKITNPFLQMQAYLGMANFLGDVYTDGVEAGERIGFEKGKREAFKTVKN